jgi:hypothetical protein
MNKFINILLFLLTFPTMLVSIFVGFDLPIEFLKVSGKSLPFKNEIFLGLGLILLVVVLRRSLRRWTGVRMVSKLEKYKWNEPMSTARKSRVFLYLALEATVMLFIGLVLINICKDAWLASTAYFVCAFDHLLFLFLGVSKNMYRVGLTSKAIVVADRDLKILYFSGLRKITIQQQTIFFDYINEFQLSFPLNCIADQNKTTFREILEQQVNRDKVFFSDNVKTL